MSDDYQNVKVDLDDAGMLMLTLSRPEKLNALNETTLTELRRILMSAKKDDAVKGLLITGEGKAFCAGADINRLAEVNALTGKRFAEQGQMVFNLLENLSKPSVIAINGYAFGGGCELAMAGTLRVAADTVQLGQPEIKLGVIPGYGGTQRLSRLVGKGRALELCLTGRNITAMEALNWGLVNQVTSSDNLIKDSKALLASIICMAPAAIKATLEVIHQGSDLSLHDAQKIEAAHFGLVCSTKDKSEGVTAFLEKRKANFTGT